jgi:hypothetical protein
MIRVPLAALALAAAPLVCRAGDTAVRLTVRPAAAPKPALKYQLLPEVRELNPGNPAQWYVRCFAEQRNFFFGKEATAERARYRSMPLAELPADKLRQYGGAALTQADWGARLDTPDWQVLDRVQTEGTDLLLPELGSLRILAAGLQVRFRGEVARREFGNATGTAKTMFALARHLGEHPTVAANLIGLSVADLALDSLEEMVQQPGCPNLYWALTDLPCPLVDLRKGVQGACALAAGELRLLRDDAPMTEDQVEELVGRLSGRTGFAREQAGQAPRNLRAKLAALVKDPAGVRAARVRLVEAGHAADLVERLPPVQVILLDEKRDYEVRRDEEMKLLGLAPWQIDTLTAGEPARGGDGLFADLLPHVVEARRAQARLEQRVGLLRHVEALRLYAAGHGGKPPADLAAAGVPLPADPFSGRPFDYRLDGATAHLRGSAPRGEEKNPAYNLCYAITVRN